MEEFLGLAHLAALQMPHLSRQPLDAAGDHSQRGEEHRVAVARDDLRGDRLRRQAQLCGDILLHTRIDMRERANGAGNRCHRHLRTRRHQARTVAGELGIVPGQLQPERRRFGVDAVAAADRQRVLVLQRSRFQRRQHRIEVLQQQISRLGQLHRQAGVQHIRAGHALMHEPAVLADRLGQPGEEGDHIMPCLALDSVDPLDIGLADGGELRAPLLANRRGRHPPGSAPTCGHPFGGQRLDLEPDAIAVGRRPDGCHLRSGVTRNHCCHCPVLVGGQLDRCTGG